MLGIIRTKFDEFLASKDATIQKRDAEVSQLAGTVDAKKTSLDLVKNKNTKAYAEKVGVLERAQQKLQEKCEELQQLKQERAELLLAWERVDDALLEKLLTNFEAWQAAVDAENSTWSADAIATDSIPKPEGTGKYELRYRKQVGLPLEVHGTGSTCDYPEVMKEDKCAEAHDEVTKAPLGKLQSIRLGAEAQEIVGRVRRQIARMLTDDQLSKKKWSAIDRGEMGQRMILDLPEEVMDMVLLSTLPSEGLRPNKALILSSSYGYLEVPAEDFDAALKIHGISQGTIRYSIRLEYLYKLIRRALKASASIVPAPILMVG